MEQQTGSAELDKARVIDELQGYVAEQLSELLREAEGQGRPLDERAEQARRQLLMYQFLPRRPFTSEDFICPGGLVGLELNRIRSFYFVVPSGGGLVTRISGQAVQVITPQSPLGEALLGKKVGDAVEVTVGGKPRTYRVVSYS